MSIFARFQVINENNKKQVVRKLMENSTPDFDFFYLSGLATLMAALGLLADNSAIVIGSMLIAPTLYPVLGVALGLVMSHQKVLGRSLYTLAKSFLIGIALAVFAGLIAVLGGGELALFESGAELTARMEPSLIYFMVAVVAGLAVSYALSQPEWSAALPGVAISVALIPPLATTGIGIAVLDMSMFFGALGLLGLNVLGIIFAAMVSFSLMNLYEKHQIAESTIKREDERVEEEKEAIEEFSNGKNENLEEEEAQTQ